MNLGAAITAYFGGDTTGLNKSAGQAEGVIARFGAQATAALSTLGISLGAGAVLGFFNTVIEKGGALQDLSDRLDGLSTDSLQAFDYAVRQAGGTSQQAVQVWEKTKLALDSLAAGSDSVTTQFAALGLSAKDFVGLGLDQSLEKIAAAYLENRDHAGAYEALVDILGNSTAPRLNAVLLQLGAEGFPAFIAGAKEAGEVMDRDAIAKMDEFGDRLENLKNRMTTWGAVAFDVVTKVAARWEALVGAFGPGASFIFGKVFGELEGGAKGATAAIEKLEPALVKTTQQLKEQKEIQDARTKFEDIIAKAQRDQVEPAKKIAEIKRQMAQYAAEAVAAGDDELKMQLAMNKQAELAVELRRVMRTEEDKRREATKLSHEETIEWAKLEVKALNALTFEEQTRLEVLRLQKQEKEVLYKIDTLLAKGPENLSKAEKLVLADLFNQKKSLDEQIAAKEQLIAAARKQAEEESKVTEELRTQVGLTRTGTSYEDQSTAALEGTLRRLQNQYYDAKGSDPNPSINGRGQSYAAAVAMQFFGQEIARVQKELDLRQSVARVAASRGEDAARRMFGDTVTDRGLREMQDDQKRATVALERIAQGLARRGLADS